MHLFSDRASYAAGHSAAERRHALLPPSDDLIRVGSRRWFLQTGLAGMAGLSLADTLRLQAAAAPAGTSPTRDRKAVILFWLSGGPSHIDMWDPKSEAPKEIRGPYRAIATRVPGIEICEHLPLQAKLMDKLSIIRSVDCSASDHTPTTLQAGNSLARRTGDGNDGQGYPSMGSIVAKYRGPNEPSLPAFVGLADSWKGDIYGAGLMGSQFEPINGKELPGRLALPKEIRLDRVQNRAELRQQFDRLARGLDVGRTMESVDRYGQMAVEMVTSDHVQQAFDLSREPDSLRDAYGRVSVGEKALLARRLVEAGVTFVVVSGAFGYFDNHGDEVVYKGIEKGLTPILPTIDRVMHALVTDLEARGLLDSTLVLMLGEFGRTPVMTPTNGRGHWMNCMSMLVAGGGLHCGQTIGATDSRGYDIKDAMVRPADLAATVFRHLDIDPSTHWMHPQGRPIQIVTEGGRPIPELG